MPNQIAPKVLNWASILDDNVRVQAEQAASMPFVQPHIALMPDAHAGLGSSVGTVIPTVDAVIPAAVGVDLGCGVGAIQTTVSKEQLEKRMADTDRDLTSLRKAVEAAIPMSMGNYNSSVKRYDFTAEKIAALEERAERDGIELGHSPKWREQLGTLGSGNHFGEGVFDENDTVWLFLHSGSRGVGNKIAQRHIKIAQDLCKRWYINLPNPDLAYLVEGTDEFWSYIREMHWAQEFALFNRAEMLDRFRLVFAEWMGLDPDAIEVDRIASHHNYTQKERHFGKDVWLTRKGAVDAHAGVRGIIPGSMGARSYVVEGLGNPAGLHSAPHGAGRVLSRTEARKRFTVEDLTERMSGIEARLDETLVDEHPSSYKDIDVVMQDASDLVKILHEFRQFVNMKGD